MGHGEFIKKIRQEKHLTQKELAEGILSKNFLSKFERRLFIGKFKSGRKTIISS